MNVLVLGAGAIGSVFGGLLGKAGNVVYLLGRKHHIQAIEKNGLLIDGIWGKHLVRNVKGITNLDDLSEKEKNGFEIVLLSVKSYDTELMLAELNKHFPSTPPVVSLQNGLGNIEKIESAVGREKTVGARVIFGVEFMDPGYVKVTVSADRTVIGGLKGGISWTFLEKLARTFTSAGLKADATQNINRFIWGKVLYNCALNGLATILDVNYGALLSSDRAREIMKNIIGEIFIVAEKQNISLDWEKPSEYIQLLFNDLIPRTFEHHPSMLQDIKRGKKTEIDALNGAVVKIAEDHGIRIPCNWTLTELIKARELIKQ